MSNKINPKSIFDVKPASQPGAHAPAGLISPEYDEKIVEDQIKHLEDLECMSFEDIEAYKLKELQKLLIEAGSNVPYWRSLFKALAFTPKDISSIDDLKKLPLLEKDMIKNNYSEFISEKVNLDEVARAAAFLVKTEYGAGAKNDFIKLFKKSI